MKLEYKILWIDNDLQSYIDNNSVESIEDFLKEQGFDPIIEKVFDEDDLNDYINKHDYDLILSDYNLNKTTGDVIIVEIRNVRHLDTEILFYTAQRSYKNNPQVIERLAFIERLTFQVGRENLLVKIEKVISLNIKKLLELNATRGLITAATSELDIEIENIVMELVKKQNLGEDNLKSIITNKVITPTKDRLDDFWKKYESFHSYFPNIDAIKKWEIFRDLLKPLKANRKIMDFLDANKTYQNDVIEVRNKFAHTKAEYINGNQVLKGRLGKSDFIYDNAACIKIRRSLITHKENIEKLKKVLSEI